jgi:hypothetical protein
MPTSSAFTVVKPGKPKLAAVRSGQPKLGKAGALLVGSERIGSVEQAVANSTEKPKPSLQSMKLDVMKAPLFDFGI